MIDPKILDGMIASMTGEKVTLAYMESRIAKQTYMNIDTSIEIMEVER